MRRLCEIWLHEDQIGDFMTLSFDRYDKQEHMECLVAQLILSCGFVYRVLRILLPLGQILHSLLGVPRSWVLLSQLVSAVHIIKGVKCTGSSYKHTCFKCGAAHSTKSSNFRPSGRTTITKPAAGVRTSNPKQKLIAFCLCYKNIMLSKLF